MLLRCCAACPQALLRGQRRIVQRVSSAHACDELLLCSTAGGILPVSEVDGRQIGNGAPGEVFRILDQGYKALLASGTRSTPIDSPALTIAR
jgi:branched-chain amino acid aminotransferase